MAISVDETARQAPFLPGFAREADMLAPLRDHRQCVTPRSTRTWDTLFEVPVTSHGIIDVMHIAFKPSVLEWRRSSGLLPILDWWELSTFLRLQSCIQEGITAAALAEDLGMSVNGLRRGALQRLMDRGHVDCVNKCKYVATWKYRYLAHELIAIEAKRTDWRAGIHQAGRYARFADRAFLALEPRAAQSAISQRTWIENHKIGVLAVRPNDLTVQIIRAAPRNSNMHSIYRTIACEYAASLVLTGIVSGPLLPVFGEMHTASTGIDPRSPQ